MNYIKIYFALPEELAKERDELADYIRSLNDFYHDRDIFFEVNFSEDPFDSFDDFPSTSDNEENQIDAIRESNYFYLIFGNHDDEGIREKFDVALDEFGKNGAPKIYTYFKKLPEGVETEQGIKDFIDRLDQAIGHYYSQFVHIDSVKLNILLELTNTSKNGDKLEFEDGHATINGTKVLPLDNIPIYQCNESLQELKAQKNRLEQESAQAAFNYAQNPNDQEAFNKMMDLSGERNRVTDKIHEIEKGMLGLCNTISEMRHSDRKLTWREIEAGKRLDIGDYDGALMILRDDQREKELAQAEAIANEGIERIRGYISENRMIISTLTTKGVSVDTLDELYSRYEKNTELAKEYHIELDCVLNHMIFLRNQKEFSHAITLGEWLKPFCQEDDKKLTLFNSLEKCYRDIHDFQQALSYHELSLSVLSKLVCEDPDTYESDIACTCNNLASLMNDMHRYKESEKMQRKALEMYRRLTKKNPVVYECNVAMACNNLANSLYYLHRYEEAEELYREALKIHRKLAQKNPEVYEEGVASSCDNLANLLRDLQQYEEPEKLYHEALEIRSRLAKKNPAAYERDMIDTYNNLANMLSYMRRYDEAEPLYREALKIRRKLYQRNPEAYENDMADTCNNLATLLLYTHRYDEAELLFCETLGIYRRLAQKNPEIYESVVARTCYNLATLMSDTHQYERAESLYREALGLYRIFARDNPETYENNLALTCINLANLLSDARQFEESEKLYCEAREILGRLARKNPEVYESNLALTCYNLAFLMKDTNRYDEAEKIYWESLEIYIRLAQKYPGVYEKDVARTSYMLADVMMDLQRYEEAKILLCSSLTLFRSLSKEDPEAYEPMISHIEKMLHILGGLK